MQVYSYFKGINSNTVKYVNRNTSANSVNEDRRGCPNGTAMCTFAFGLTVSAL